MQRPNLDASSETNLAFTDHIEGAAKAWSQAEIISQKQQEAVQSVCALILAASTTLRASAAATAAAERATREARAAFIVRDVILDLRVMGLSDALLNGPALRDRKSQVYNLVFVDKNAGEITKAKMREEPELVVGIIHRFNGLGDFDGKAAAIGIAAGAVEKSVTAREALDAAELTESKAKSAELAARIVLRDAIDEAYGVLRAAFPGRRDFVESFFPKRESSAASSSKDAPEGAPAGSGASPAGG